MLRKKWLSLLVAISMVAAMFPSTVFANETDTVEQGTGTGTEIVTNAPKDDTLDTEEGTETLDVVADEDTDTDETDQGTDETKKDEAVTNTEEEPPAEGTKPEQPTVPETTPIETPNSTISEPTPEQIMAATNGMLQTADNTEEDITTPAETSEKVDPNGLKDAITAAKDGATIRLTKGTFDIGNLTLDRAITFQGSGPETILVGHITYKFADAKTVLIQGLTLRAPETTSGNQAINLQQANGATLTVKDCNIENYLFGIGVNSGASNCTLNVSGVTLTNVWCGAGVSNSNNVTFDATDDSTVTYEIQKFTSGVPDNNYYYPTYEDIDSETNRVHGTDITVPTVSDWANSTYEVVVTTADGKISYTTLDDAVKEANDGATVELLKNVELTKQLDIYADNITLDLNNKEITAAESFNHSDKNSSHLATVYGDGVTIKEGTLRGTANSRHGVNVYGGSVTLKDLTVDVTASTNSKLGKGTPLVVNGTPKAASATLAGNVTLTGSGWTAIDMGKDTDEVSLNVEPEAQVKLNSLLRGISGDSTNATVNFGENVTVDIPTTIKVSLKSGAELTGIENTGLTAEDVNAIASVSQSDGKPTYYTSMEDAIAAVEGASKQNGPVTLTLYKDITLDKPIEVPEGLNLIVEGNGKTITLPESGKMSAFNATDENNLEGLLPSTNLTVNNANFVGHIINGSPQGHAAVTGFGGGVDVTLSNCGFTDMHDAIYCNPVTGEGKEVSNITIVEGNFKNVDYAYGWNNGNNGGESTKLHEFDVSFAEGSEQPGVESFAEAEVNGKGYPTLEAAIAAAQSGGTVKLLKDASLESMLTINKGITLDLDGHKISGDGTFTGSADDKEQNHLIDIVSTDETVTIKNGTLEAGENNNHTLNVWNAGSVNLENLKIDNSKISDREVEKQQGGAPLIVGGSNVSMKDVTLQTGDNSWYAANFDSKNGKGSSLTVDGDLTFVGQNASNTGIFVQDGENVGKDNMQVTFQPGTTVTGNGVDGFKVLVFDTNAAGTVTNDGTNLITDENGNLIVKPVSTGTSHEHSYVWQGSPDEHWQYCTECGQVVSNGAHTFQWKDGVQVCSVCGYKLTQTSSTSTAPAGSTAAAAAAPAAGTAATAATGIPQTSDNSNPMLWVVLLALSGSALGGMTIYKKKKEN